MSDLITSALADRQRIRDHEEFLFVHAAPNELDEKTRTWIDQLFRTWLGDAVQVAARADLIEREGAQLPAAGQLRHAIMATQARLKVSVPAITSALRQVEAGQFIPAKELRDELNARLRAYFALQ